MDIRLLKANEIECRIGTFKEGKGISLLLYKDARVDMRILDEVFGFDGWEREHHLIDSKLFCTVRVWSEKRGCWISKQDVGTESNTEKEKGQVSDSFKRACFNLGIGRELYTSPFIWIPASMGYSKYEKFEVKDIGYNEEREIDFLVITDSKGNECFRFGGKRKQNIKNKDTSIDVIIDDEQKKELFLVAKGLDTKIVKEILHSFGFENSSEITKKEFKNVCDSIEKSKEMYGVVGA